MLKATHCGQWHRLCETLAVSRYLENITVLLLAAHNLCSFKARSRIPESLFAGKPAAPGHGATGAIYFGAGQAQVNAESFARCRIVVNCRCPAGSRCHAIAIVVDSILVDKTQSFAIPAECTFVLSRRVDFMIADDSDRAVFIGKSRHAIVLRRHEQAIVHFFALAGNDCVGKAFRQIDDFVRIPNEDTESGRRAIFVLCGRNSRG